MTTGCLSQDGRQVLRLRKAGSGGIDQCWIRVVTGQVTMASTTRTVRGDASLPFRCSEETEVYDFDLNELLVDGSRQAKEFLADRSPEVRPRLERAEFMIGFSDLVNERARSWISGILCVRDGSDLGAGDDDRRLP